MHSTGVLQGDSSIKIPGIRMHSTGVLQGDSSIKIPGIRMHCLCRGSLDIRSIGMNP